MCRSCGYRGWWRRRWPEFRRRQIKWTRCLHVIFMITVLYDCELELIKRLKSLPADNIIKRVFNIIKFTWVLFLTTIESITTWLNSVCREYIDISTVLRIERCMLTREVKKVCSEQCRCSIWCYIRALMATSVCHAGKRTVAWEHSCVLSEADETQCVSWIRTGSDQRGGLGLTQRTPQTGRTQSGFIRVPGQHLQVLITFRGMIC